MELLLPFGVSSAMWSASADSHHVLRIILNWSALEIMCTALNAGSPVLTLSTLTVWLGGRCTCPPLLSTKK